MSMNTALKQIADMDPEGIRADDLGRAARIAREALASSGQAASAVPEGRTPADAMVLRKANHAFAEDNERLRIALRFYANGEHFNTDDKEEFDTVSGEPTNWLCSGVENSTTMIEDGAVAAMALRGIDANWKDGDEDLTPKPIDGEQWSSPTQPASAPAREGATLRERLQQRCSDWGVYWRASDAHGVDLSHEQALDLLRDALGVEVEIATPAAQAQPRDEAEPIDMVLHCPACGLQHIDAPDERTPNWKNEPHRSHLCHGCGHIWRPADVPTNGVQAVKTKGKADSPPAPRAPSIEPTDQFGRTAEMIRFQSDLDAGDDE